jgi:chromosome segregation ATPase
MDAALSTSDQLANAIRAEQRELARQAGGLRASREKLLSELGQVERKLAAVAERDALLERLSSTETSAQDAPSAGDGAMEPKPASEHPATRPLRGPEIRRAAVEVLLGDPVAARVGVHYREWYDRLVAAHFNVVGKDPVAVFLTQLTRSPVVSKTERPGTYRIDLDSPARLRKAIDGLTRALREISTVTITRPAELRHVRERRRELTAQIQQTEKALEEVLDLLEPSSP